MMNSFVICVVFGSIVYLVNAGPVVDDGKEHNPNLVHSTDYTTDEESLIKKLNGKCTTRDYNSCLMLKVITYFNRLLKKSQIDIGGVEITKTSKETLTKSGSRNLNGNDDEQVSQLLFDKVWTFIQTRSLKWKVMDEAEVIIHGNNGKDGGINIDLSLRPTKTDEGEARKKKNNNMGPLLAAAALKIGLLKALAFKAIALLVGKALLVSKLALVLAAIIGLKKLFSQEKHVTYEVVGHPHHETHHEHSFSSAGGHESYGGGWARNYEGNKLAYRAHGPL